MQYSEIWPRRWLQLGVAALAIAGVFAVLLVVARTPQLAWAKELFSVALVIHVDLSVFVWFLSVIGLGCSRYLTQQNVPHFPYLQASAFWSMAAGTALMALSPLEGEWEVIKSNYIPVLYNPIFFLGLSLMAASMLVLSLAVVVSEMRPKATGREETFCWQVMGWVVLMALSMFAANAVLLNPAIALKDSYEFVFWSGGHTLQFAFTLVAMLAWLALYKVLRGEALLGDRGYKTIGIITLLGVVYPLFAYLYHPVDSEAFRQIFTDAMKYLGGLAPAGIMLLIAWKLCKVKPAYSGKHPAFSALIMSLVVFGAGGALGFLIQGQNVTIPAHYHGSIVGVTIALMGYAYLLLPQLGWRDVSGSRTAFWQPVWLGVGQLMHVGGLAYSGGYGVLRKQAAEGVEFAPEVKVALGVMGAGGLLAIIGGFMFVVVMVRAFTTRNNA